MSYPPQQPAYGQQPPPGYGYMPPPPPRKSRTGLVIGVLAGVFLLVAGVIIAVVAFSGPSIQDTAEEYAAAVTSKDVAKTTSMLCPEIRQEVEKSMRQVPQAQLEQERRNRSVTATVKEVRRSGDVAEVMFHFAGEANGQKIDRTPVYTWKRTDDGWELCDPEFIGR